MFPSARPNLHEPPPASTVAERLKRARQRRFVGRAAELELFLGALAAPEPPFSVLWIYGPGGVGKTALLTALAETAADAGVGVVSLDLRAIEPSPPAFMAELGRALGLPAERAATAPAASRPSCCWIPSRLRSGSRTGCGSISSRRCRRVRWSWWRAGTRPGEAWRRDAGWGDLLRVVSLRNLGPDEARACLRSVGVAEERQAWMLELSHGHPLALSLLVDVLSQRQAMGDVGPLELGAAPDVVGKLVESFLADVPSPRHRLALECVAHARLTTAGLMAESSASREGGELFSWLRGLSFIESGPFGMFPHDLAREVIDADLRWRDPAAYRDLHVRVRRHVVARIWGSEGRERGRAIADLIFLHRGNPAAAALWDWKSLGEVYADPLRDGDPEAIRPWSSATRARSRRRSRSTGWSASPRVLCLPGTWPRTAGLRCAYRSARGQRGGRRARSRGNGSMGSRAAPRAAATGGRGADRPVPGRPRRVSSAVSLFNVVTMRSMQEWLGRRRLSWYYIVAADPKAMAPLMDYIHFHRAVDADFEVGGRQYGVFARDWRRVGGVEWLERMAERELGDDAPAPDSEHAPGPQLALSQPEFADAVRRALRDMHRPEALAANPLARTRVVRDHGAGLPAHEALRELLGEAIDALRADPRGERLVRALERTYVRPAPTQEAAAELLGLPFSTYRGHLTRGLERIVDWLWQRELYGA